MLVSFSYFLKKVFSLQYLSVCVCFVSGEAWAWTYLCDILSALEHLHAQGFAHLDIKPANVFITKSGRLKLGDFGLLIKLSSDAQKQGRYQDDLQEGDPRYMAPELLRGRYGTAADIFRLVYVILDCFAVYFLFRCLVFNSCHSGLPTVDPFLCKGFGLDHLKVQ